MKIHGNITQIESDYENVTMNIVGVNNSGYLGVEFSTYQKPTYLFRYRDGSIMRIMIFGNKEWADEWLETYGDIYQNGERLDAHYTSVAASDETRE